MASVGIHEPGREFLCNTRELLLDDDDVHLHEGRPGPNAGGSRASHVQILLFSGPAADTRVGDNLGRGTPEAPTIDLSPCTTQAKSDDPVNAKVLEHSTAISPHAAPHATWHHDRYDQFPSPPPQSGVPGKRPAQHKRRRPCLLDLCFRLPLCVLSAISLRYIAKMLGPRHSKCWNSTRQCPGQYRRRPGLICLPRRIRDLLPHSPKIGLPNQIPGQPSAPGATAGSRPARTTSCPVIGPRLLKLTLWGYMLCQSLGHPISNPDTRLDYAAGPREPSRHTFRAHHQFVQRLTPARKRAFRRAQQRAVRDGYAWYKGQRHTPESLSIKPLTQTSRPSARPSSHSATTTDPSFQIVTWNSGGLNAVRYQEFLGWIDPQDSATARSTLNPNTPSTDIRIACLQETHWPQSSEYRYKHWTMIHSGSGRSTGGVLFAISARLVSPQLIRYAEIIPGRALHIRLETNPPMDILGIYQVAWNLQRKGETGQSDPQHTSLEDLLQQRASVWHAVRKWLASVPKRNALYVIGDFNCTLKPSLPHVGTGIAHHTSLVHKDQATLQRIVADYSLTALNTWGKAGPSAQTFLRPPHHGVQIDFILGRLPGTPQARTAHAVPEAPVVHPTGMRHVPVMATVTLPKLPQTHRSSTWKPQEVKQDLHRNPDLIQIFKQKVTETILVAPDLNTCLEQAWQQAKNSVPGSLRTGHTSSTSPAPPSPQPPTTLKEYWQCKQQLRQAQLSCQAFCAPLLWMISSTGPANIWQHHRQSARQCVGKLFHLWRAGARFDHCNRLLRKRTKEHKLAKIDQLITETTQASKQGYSGLHQLINKLRPKSHKRSTHFRHPSGDLMTPQEELRHLADFFQELYASNTGSPGRWVLQQALTITVDEVKRALRAMPASKALPKHQAPAILWRNAEESIIPALCETFNHLLQPGPLHFPDRILTSYLVLLAKPGKPPTKPSNLRPINLLPAEAKILARIAAERLRPLLASKLESIPQFAYTGQRQTGDAIDRVMAHCQRVRSALKSHQHNIFDKRTGKQRQPFTGGLQLSLDLKQAFDRIPRQQLLSSLEQLDIPADLTSLILYIHDYAKVVIERPTGAESVCMRRGIRQGCGLAPLLWLAYTIVIHDTLSAYIPVDSLTEYADDLHVQWEFKHPRDFRRACTQIPKILQDLENLGMLVSVDKTVVLLAMKGAATQQLLRDFTTRRGGERFLILSGPFGRMRLPIRTHHTYLGIRIGYSTFERATVQLRASQAWTAFHRLHPFLKNPTIPLNKRLQLWLSGVWPVLSYGLSSVGVDHVCANQINQLVLKQLRMVARSPPHITHETNLDLLTRLRLTSPMQMLRQICQARNATGRPAVSHLQSDSVQQWWSLVTVSFQQPTHQLEGSDTQVRATLTEVTRIQRFKCSCPTCGQSFPSTHALSVHIGRCILTVGLLSPGTLEPRILG